MELKTFYKDGKEYAADALGTAKEVNAEDDSVIINGINYKLAHTKASKSEPEIVEAEPTEEKAPAKKKTNERKK